MSERCKLLSSCVWQKKMGIHFLQSSSLRWRSVILFGSILFICFLILSVQDGVFNQTSMLIDVFPRKYIFWKCSSLYSSHLSLFSTAVTYFFSIFLFSSSSLGLWLYQFWISYPIVSAIVFLLLPYMVNKIDKLKRLKMQSCADWSNIYFLKPVMN